jgi:hypothetical protein
VWVGGNEKSWESEWHTIWWQEGWYSNKSQGSARSSFTQQRNRPIPRSYVTVGITTSDVSLDDVSRDDVSRDRFSTKHSFKVRRAVSENLCWPNEEGIILLNPLPPNVIYICRTAPLNSRRYILNISSTNIRTEYFKHAA